MHGSGSPFSVDDVFTAGVSFDLIGGYLLGRGLLVKPLAVVRRSAMITGGNPHDMAAMIENRADALLGLTSLLLGFLLQFAGYLALIAGAGIETGGGRALFASAFALLAAVVAVIAARRARPELLRRMAVGVARVDLNTGDMRDMPNGQLLVYLGEAFGWPHQGLPMEEYVRRVFGIEIRGPSSDPLT